MLALRSERSRKSHQRLRRGQTNRQEERRERTPISCQAILTHCSSDSVRKTWMLELLTLAGPSPGARLTLTCNSRERKNESIVSSSLKSKQEMDWTHRNSLCDLLFLLILRVFVSLSSSLASALLLGLLVQGRKVVERRSELHLKCERVQVESAWKYDKESFQSVSTCPIEAGNLSTKRCCEGRGERT